MPKIGMLLLIDRNKMNASDFFKLACSILGPYCLAALSVLDVQL